MPSYPEILIDKKLYLAGGVAAAFECKTTLKASHVQDAVETATLIRQNLPVRNGSPYSELNSMIIYGLLAYSHSWKGEQSKPINIIEEKLISSDEMFVKHPRQCLDYLCVADLATWSVAKMTYVSPQTNILNEQLAKIHGKDGFATSGYIRHAIGDDGQQDFFSPIGTLLSGIFSNLAWTFTDMRNLERYFRSVNLQGRGRGTLRFWNIDIYSDLIKDRVFRGQLTNGAMFDEWSIYF